MMLEEQIRKSVEELIRRAETVRLEALAVKLDELLTGKELSQEDLLRLILSQVKANRHSTQIANNVVGALSVVASQITVPAGGTVSTEVTTASAYALLPKGFHIHADKNLHSIELTSVILQGMNQLLTALPISVFSNDVVPVDWAVFGHTYPLTLCFTNSSGEDVNVSAMIYGERAESDLFGGGRAAGGGATGVYGRWTPTGTGGTGGGRRF